MSSFESLDALPLNLNDEQKIYRFVAELLTSPGCPEYTMNIDQLSGYLRALAAEPGPTDYRDWMPLVFGNEIPKSIEGYSMDSVVAAIISLYNSHKTEVLVCKCTLPFQISYSADRDKRIRAEQWARGFMQGYIFWQPIWSRLFDGEQTNDNQAVILPISVNDELDAILANVTAVADANYVLQSGVTQEELEKMFDQFPQKVIDYGRIAHIIRGKLDCFITAT